MGVALDATGKLYIADTVDNAIEVVNGGYVSIFAGTGTAGYYGDGGLAGSAMLNNPVGLTMDAVGNLYIADTGNNVVRKVSAATQIITTIAGNHSNPGYTGDSGPANSAGLQGPRGVAVDYAGNLYIADRNNAAVRRVDAATQIITTVAGTGTQGYSGDNGPATSAKLNAPTGVAVDAAGNLYIADPAVNAVRKVDAATQIITTLAGTGTPNYSGDNGPANSATLNGPYAVALDSVGNLYISDSNNNVVRVVSATAAPLSFPTTIVGGSSPEQTVTLSNIGNTSMTLNSTATATANFVVDTSSPCLQVTSLDIGASCLAEVYFAPTVTGSVPPDSLTFIDTALNVIGATQSVALTGTGQSRQAQITLQTSAATILLENTINFTAKVTAAGTPTGSVNFMDGSTLLGGAALDNTGTATLGVSTLAAGSHSITAVYGGDSNFTGVTSAALTETVQDFQFVISGGGTGTVLSASVLAGGVATYQFQISPTSGTTFPGIVSLSLSGLPAGATYSITPATINAGSGAQTVTVQVQTTKPVAGMRQRGPGVVFALALLPLLGMVSLRRIFRTKAKRTAMLLLLLLVFAILGMSSCAGGSGFLSQNTQTHALTLTATSGSLQHSTTLNLTVQ